MADCIATLKIKLYCYHFYSYVLKAAFSFSKICLLKVISKQQCITQQYYNKQSASEILEIKFIKNITDTQYCIGLVLKGLCLKHTLPFSESTFISETICISFPHGLSFFFHILLLISIAFQTHLSIS